jgi:hypothetical protein
MSTPIELLKSVYDETLVNICKSMKDSVSKDSGADLVMIKGQLKDAINKIFEGYTCVEIITTNNTDNILFGINISPTLTDADRRQSYFSPKALSAGSCVSRILGYSAFQSRES